VVQIKQCQSSWGQVSGDLQCRSFGLLYRCRGQMLKKAVSAHVETRHTSTPFLTWAATGSPPSIACYRKGQKQKTAIQRGNWRHGGKCEISCIERGAIRVCGSRGPRFEGAGASALAANLIGLPNFCPHKKCAPAENALTHIPSLSPGLSQSSFFVVCLPVA
jgi:hypothetical protein